MKRLLLVGGGQAHAFVLRALAAAPRRDVEVVLVTPSDRLVYTRHAAGLGRRALHACRNSRFRCAPLAAAAGAVLMHRRVTGLDLERKAVRDRPRRG